MAEAMLNQTSCLVPSPHSKTTSMQLVRMDSTRLAASPAWMYCRARGGRFRRAQQVPQSHVLRLPTLLHVAILHPISLSLGLMLNFHAMVTNSTPRWRSATTIDGVSLVISRQSSRQTCCCYSLGVAAFHTTGDRRGPII